MLDTTHETRTGWSKGPSLLPRRFFEFRTPENKWGHSYSDSVRVYEDQIVDYLEQVIALKTPTVRIIDTADELDAQPALESKTFPSPDDLRLKANPHGLPDHLLRYQEAMKALENKKGYT